MTDDNSVPKIRADKNKRVPNIRIDFKFLQVTEDGTLIFQLDPDRYEVRTDAENGCMVLDKYEHLAIPEAVLEDLLRKTSGVPVFNQMSKIADAKQYLLSRTGAVDALLDGEASNVPPIIGSERLRERIGDTALFSILHLEVANATEIIEIAGDTQYRNLVKALAYEAAQIVDLHLGHSLQLGPTSLTFFFAAPSYITKADLSMECARVLDGIITVLNASLHARNLPKVHYRIGLESGDAQIDSLGHIDFEARINLIGRTRVAAEEICRAAPIDTIYVGPFAAAALHSSWRRLLQPVEVPKSLILQSPWGDSDRAKLYTLPLDAVEAAEPDSDPQTA